MPKAWLYTLILLLSWTLSQHASAIEREDIYLGVKTGRYLINVEKGNDATALGLQAGFEFLPGLAFEVEAMDGETFIDSEDLELDTVGFYGTYRSDGDKYFMLKLGRVDQVRKTEDDEETDGTVSWGVGAGMEFGEHFSIEIDMTTIDTDITFIGVNTRFMFEGLNIF